MEEAQLARALLGLIADDLRSAVRHNPERLEDSMPNLAMSAGGSDGAGGGAGGGASDFGAGDLDIEEGDSSDSDGTDDSAESLAAAPVPGLYGNSYQLQIDTSRLPRIDQLQGILAAGDSLSVARLSDVKTVTYYVGEDQLSGTAAVSGISQAGGGLVRHEMDRAPAAYAAEMGQLAEMQQDLQAIAPEVAAIQFLYFDGTEVVEEWDSEVRGGLPMAVEVTLYIRPQRLRDTSLASVRTPAESAAFDATGLLVYRLLVHLPGSKPTTLEGTSATSEGSWEGFFDE